MGSLDCRCGVAGLLPESPASQYLFDACGSSPSVCRSSVVLQLDSRGGGPRCSTSGVWLVAGRKIAANRPVLQISFDLEMPRTRCPMIPPFSARFPKSSSKRYPWIYAPDSIVLAAFNHDLCLTGNENSRHPVRPGGAEKDDRPLRAHASQCGHIEAFAR